MLKTNRKSLVMQAVQGEISAPKDLSDKGRDGLHRILPMTDGITFNVNVGDSAFGWEADHVEPSVSITHLDDAKQSGLVRLACVGNKAVVAEGDAKGEVGFILGKHGGAWNVVTQFSQDAMEKMVYGEKINIRTFGQGLELIDYPDIMAMSIDPDLLERLDIEQGIDEIVVPVTAKVPGFLLGSGVGCGPAQVGDVDLMTGDKGLLEKLGLDQLCLGDFVLMEDVDHSFGTGVVKGATSIGVVIHGDSYIGGHGPGITPVLTCRTNKIKGVIDKTANLKKYL